MQPQTISPTGFRRIRIRTGENRDFGIDADLRQILLDNGYRILERRGILGLQADAEAIGITCLLKQFLGFFRIVFVALHGIAIEVLTDAKLITNIRVVSPNSLYKRIRVNRVTDGLTDQQVAGRVISLEIQGIEAKQICMGFDRAGLYVIAHHFERAGCLGIRCEIRINFAALQRRRSDQRIRIDDVFHFIEHDLAAPVIIASLESL